MIKQYFRHNYKGLEILVEIIDDGKSTSGTIADTIALYGQEYGVDRLVIRDGIKTNVLISNEVVRMDDNDYSIR